MNIIEIKNVSKKYQIAHEKNNPYASLKEILSDWIKSPFKRTPASTQEEFWALQDIHLNIQEGDRVALLGRNGAGKSTLLKILSRITEPSSGSISIHGRVSSLLEVGTGFHPDLTGRENIFLNGAIMGLSYKEIKRKFDEIVLFAGIEKFLDTPVKRYSSGMFMRLGFAIAAHLDSDLLILDEVLAVGDLQFQKKCLEKINEIAAKGSAILFVSHHIHSVLALCNKGIFLEKGRLKAMGPIKECVGHYLQSCPLQGFEWKGELGSDIFRITRFSLSPPEGGETFFLTQEKSALVVEFELLKPGILPFLGFTVLNERHIPIAQSYFQDVGPHLFSDQETGDFSLSFPFEWELFHPGEYQIRLECFYPHQKKLLEEEILLSFTLLAQPDQTVGLPRPETSGMSLGNRWQIN
jgi:lipopolysaccharide transport system ATP-binding protein